MFAASHRMHRDVLRRYSWPGNVRELTECDSPSGSADDRIGAVGRFPSGQRPSRRWRFGHPRGSRGYDAIDQLIHDKRRSETTHLYDDVVGTVEERLVSEVLKDTKDDPHAALERLGVPPMQLVRRQRANHRASNFPADAPGRSAGGQT